MTGTLTFTAWNLLTVILVVIIAISVVQGASRGASGSARQFIQMLTDSGITLVSLYGAWLLMRPLSEWLREWLLARNIEIPDRELNILSQTYYTIITSLRDFSLMRSALILIVAYGLLKGILSYTAYWLLSRFGPETGSGPIPGSRATWASAPVGALFGAVTGTGRALLLIAAVLVYVSLFPDSPVSGYAQKSFLYQKGATEIIKPVAGDLLNQLPVVSRAVEQEFQQILQRKYEVLDAQIPDNIAETAQKVTKGKKTDKEKAKALYDWVGSRVRYDWDKVRLYEENQVWKEQSPEDTFQTRSGVCIDYSRLYAMMARSVGLQVKVVTGLGYDGKGGYGAHAWNEVYLSGRWVPLDTTWASSGGNWFDPPDFYDTHIKES